MIIRGVTGIRKAMEASQGKIEVQTKHFGLTQLTLTWHYKHLGGMLNGEGDMDPEIIRRNAMATAYDLRMATKVYKEVLVLSSVKLMLSNAVSFSRLRCNCKIWTKLIVKQSKQWTASYNNIIPNVTSKFNGPDNQWTKVQVLADEG